MRRGLGSDCRDSIVPRLTEMTGKAENGEDEAYDGTDELI